VATRTTVFGAIVATALVGCGKDPPAIATLQGTVSLGAKPVTAGIVSVRSEDGVTLASAEIRPDGTYSVVGVPVGAVRLRVETSGCRMIEPEPGRGTAGPKRNPLHVAIPKRYEAFDTSGLTATIGGSGSTLDIVLEE
jgi:hypothetical protein